MSNDTVEVIIFGNSYQVMCPHDQVDLLQSAAAMVDKKMRDIRTAGRLMSPDRIAMMAALNISRELLLRDKEQPGIGIKMLELSQKITHTLGNAE